MNDMVAFTRALADETRQEIMDRLCCRLLNVSQVVEELDGRVNQPTVSHHLKKLQQAGLVLTRQSGRQHFYTLNQARIFDCCNSLAKDFAPDFGTVQEEK
jgi:ArsR family transcriptional regulator, arsenate/arsenite/antimonite-responsive transcriptional repressor